MNMPPILQQLAQNPMQQIKNLMMTVKNAGNPQAMLNQMANSNPNLKQAMDFVKQSGGDPKKAFYALAQQKGVNPDDIINMLK